MNYIILASALRTSGALSIYKQFIYHLPDYVQNDKYFIFIDSNVPQPAISGVTYIYDCDHSWKHRLFWDYCGLDRWLKKNEIVPDVIVSLQNTGVMTKCRQLIYYHQPLPFFDRKWSFLKKEERIMWLYKHIYPIFVSKTLNNKTDVVVQIPYIKKKFIEKFRIHGSKVHVLFPDIEKIDINNIADYPYEQGTYNFVFPATPNPYKEHKTLCYALQQIKIKDINLYKKIRIHFTINQDENRILDRYIQDSGIEDAFILHGRVPHESLLSMYRSSDGLLFPSTIETLGLPLLEAAAFGLPIIASNLDYAHEVMGDYEGVKYVDSYDYDCWAEAILQLCELKRRYKPIQYNESTWGIFFNLIKGNYK